MHGFIPSTKNDARQSVKLLEAYGGRRVERHEAHDGRLDIGRRAEVILAHAHHMVDLCVQLHVGGQAGPERGTGLRNQSHRELALEHQYGHSEERSMRQQAEDERGGYLVGRVGNADVKVGQLCFYKVAYDDLESTLLGPRGQIFCFVELKKEAIGDGWWTYLPCTRFVSSAAMRGSISTAVQCFAFSNIRTVRFPVPGPTSRTLSVGRRLACMAK